MVVPCVSFAQSVSSALSKLSSSAVSAVKLESAILGTEEVSASSLVGDWEYSRPCMVFESDNVLSAVGTSAMASKGESYLQKGLAKAGFSAGDVTLSFSSDGTTGIVVAGKSVSGVYSVDGSEMTITYNGVLSGVSKSVTANVVVSGEEMRVSMSAQKLLTLVQTVSATASSANTTLSTVSSLFSSVDGMYVGLVFVKK